VGSNGSKNAAITAQRSPFRRRWQKLRAYREELRRMSHAPRCEISTTRTPGWRRHSCGVPVLPTDTLYGFNALSGRTPSGTSPP
jgi:hypothetical protein